MRFFVYITLIIGKNYEESFSGKTVNKRLIFKKNSDDETATKIIWWNLFDVLKIVSGVTNKYDPPKSTIPGKTYVPFKVKIFYSYQGCPW